MPINMFAIRKFFILMFLLHLLAFSPFAFSQESTTQSLKDQKKTKNSSDYSSEYAGIRFIKPYPDWIVKDSGPEAIHRIICVAKENDEWSPRFCILVMPGNAMPDGMESRRQQVSRLRSDSQAQVFHQNKFEKTTLAGKEAILFSYDLELEQVLHTVEYGFFNQENFYIVQAAALASEWEKPETATVFEKAFNSIGLIKIPTLSHK